MNALVDTLPASVEVAGKEYPINTGFRVCLLCILAWEDPELTIEEKTQVMLELLYPEIPEDVQAAAEMAVLFLDGGKEEGATSADAGARVFSFDKDAKYIYAAIKQRYGVDLNAEPDLHWWKFLWMFADLPEDCFFHRMISLRRGYQTGKLTKEEREAYAALQDVMELPEHLTAEEQEAGDEFMRLLNGG